MSTGWNADVGAAAPAAPDGTDAALPSALEQRATEVIVLDGSTFAVSGPTGDIEDGVQGLYLLDTRIINHFVVRVAGRRIRPLAPHHLAPFSCRFVGRVPLARGAADSPLLVVRSRSVGSGLSEWIELRNHSTEAISVSVELVVGADFAGLFDVKAGRPSPGRPTAGRVDPAGRALLLSDPADGDGTGTGGGIGSGTGSGIGGGTGSGERWQAEIRPVTTGATLLPGRIRWRARIAPGGTWRACLEVALRLGDRLHAPTHPCGTPLGSAVPAVRMASWRTNAPHVSAGDGGFVRAVDRALEDLGMLRIFDPAHPDRVVVAAGAPWYMTLFGRDALLTAWMALPLGPELALGVLRSLADRQGERTDPATEEQPGRILHEVRHDRTTMQTLDGHQAYYGSVDATALFVMLAGELARWGVDPSLLAPLLEPVDRALRWIDELGDRDGDGFVEYERATEHGLRNQGWKDSWDGVRFHDGRLAEPPVALAEVQGYVYAAYRARAVLADVLEASAGADRWRSRAAALRGRFDAAFWDDRRGWYAMALDGRKQRADALASNLGHCLWSGIVPPRRRAAVAALLTGPALASGFGLRTLAGTAAGFNPISYHCGSVWPHDTAIAVAGLADRGFPDAAAALARQLLDAADRFDGRLPELFGGFDRAEFDPPVPYPASCSPQAWAAGAPLLLLRAMLGLRPDIPNGTVRLAPRLPARLGHLRVEGLWVAGRRVTIEVDEGGGPVHVVGLAGSGLRIV